jgi:hypothetical protein
LACCGLGGDLGWVPRGSLQKDFEAACLAANENQLQSTKTSFGFHLFIVEAKKTHSMESPQQSAQVSEALRLLSHSIVSRTVPEAHPVWAVPSKETKRKRGPSRNDPPKNNKNEVGIVVFVLQEDNSFGSFLLLGRNQGYRCFNRKRIGPTFCTMEKRK